VVELQELMKAGLRRFAKAVSVVAAEHDGVRYAMSATAVCEVSLAPPTLLICVNASSSMIAPLLAGADFSLNILSVGQENIAGACGGQRRGDERFEVGEWERSESGFWILPQAQASFMCRHRDHLKVGTHTIFVGDVLDVTVSKNVDPLIYLDRSYVQASELTKAAV